MGPRIVMIFSALSSLVYIPVKQQPNCLQWCLWYYFPLRRPQFYDNSWQATFILLQLIWLCKQGATSRGARHRYTPGKQKSSNQKSGNHLQSRSLIIYYWISWDFYIKSLRQLANTRWDEILLAIYRLMVKNCFCKLWAPTMLTQDGCTISFYPDAIER